MSSTPENSIVDAAPPVSYRFLSHAELKSFGLDLRPLISVSTASESLMGTCTVASGEVRYPAFQFDGRLNKAALHSPRALFAANSLSDGCLWDSLRTRHTSLGGMNGVDFLLDYFHPDVAAMAETERSELLDEVLSEEVWRAQQ